MKLAMTGLGKRGANMARRPAGAGHDVNMAHKGRWPVHDAIDCTVSIPVLALQMRYCSRQDPSLDALRAGFGAHSIRQTDSGCSDS